MTSLTSSAKGSMQIGFRELLTLFVKDSLRKQGKLSIRFNLDMFRENRLSSTRRYSFVNVLSMFFFLGGGGGS